MNKKTNIILAMLLAVVGVFSLTSCKDDEPVVAKAVLCSIFSHDFEAAGGEIEVKVVSDALWHVEAPEWITVNPSTGSGTTFVTISANSNYSGTEMLAPRSGEVVFKGNTKASEAVVVVKQVGDTFKGTAEIDATAFYSTKNGDVVVVKNMTVVATYANGFIATDGKAIVNSQIATVPTVGTTVTIFGIRQTDKYGMAYVEAEKTEVGGTSSTLPAAEDITAKVDDKDFTVSKLAYVKISGLYNAGSNSIVIPDKTNRGFVVAYANGVDMSKMSSHSVTVDAFLLGIAAPAVNIIVTGYTDNGQAESVIFSEDFEWLAPWTDSETQSSKVSDTIGENETKPGGGDARQLTTNKADGVTTLDALLAKGYDFVIAAVNGETPRDKGKQIYLQRNYLKFGLTNQRAGLVLPVFNTENTYESPIMSFDWVTMRQGGGGWDQTRLVVIVENGSDKQVFDVDPLDLPAEGPGADNKDKFIEFKWYPATVSLTGATIKKGTKITIRPCDEHFDTTPSDLTVIRFFLDNIKIVEK